MHRRLQRPACSGDVLRRRQESIGIGELLRITPTGNTTLFLTFRPSANEAPYTGNLILSETVPPNNVKPGLSAPGGPITSIDVSVWVGYGGGNGGAAAVPSDSAQITYIVACDDDDPSTGDIIQQLIAFLIALLRTLLNR